MTTDELQAALNDPTRSIIEDPAGAGDVLVIAFGGVANKFDGIPPFEFLSVLTATSTRCVFVRDLAQSWYQAGTPGGTGTVADFVEPLRDLVRARAPRRVVTIGVSAGGWGAIQMGCALGVDHVVAFSPQTFTGRWARRLHRETRWPNETANVDRLDPRAVCRDLLPVVRAAAGAGTRPHIEVHVGREARVDLRHARRLRKLPNVTITMHDAGHNTARTLRDQGRLTPILARAVSGEAPDD